jgi:hypothetical protein
MDAATASTETIDLRTRVKVRRDDNPFASMTEDERMRLIIRVLCGLVALDEPELSGS